jgi:sec-independent protein translocase protein TatB
MFEIGWSELLVIAVVAIVVVGPKDLPRMMRSFGFYVGKLRRMAGDFQRQFEDAVRESELDEVRQAMQSVREATPSLDLKAPIDKPLMLPQPVPQGTQTVASSAPRPTSRAKPKAKPRAKPKAAKPTAAKRKSANAPKRKPPRGRKP